MDTNVQNIACLGKIISISNMQHLRKFEGQFIKMLRNTKAELKKYVAYKKRVYLNWLK